VNASVLVDAPGARPHHRQGDTRPAGYGALSFRFGVHCPDPTLRRQLEAVLWPLRRAEPPAHWYSMTGDPGRIEVRLDGVRVARSRDATNAAAWLLWHVNIASVEASPRYLALHAAGVVASGRGIVLPGPSGSGKTTLAAALVRRGMGYLSDEVVALEDIRHQVSLLSYPKALALDPASIAALWGPDAAVASDGIAVFEGEAKAHVVPDRIREGAVARSCPARMVVVPRFVPGARTQLVALDGADALVELATNAINLDRHGGAGLRRLAGLAERGACYRLDFSDLDDACRAVEAEVERLDAEPLPYEPLQGMTA
jgi:hypothetical protein